MLNHATPIPGQDTLLSCWRALADTEFGPGQLVETQHATAAVFPDFGYFNNAILTADLGFADAAAVSLAELYATAGISTWALWVPSQAAALHDHADRVGAVGTLARDVTTLAMQRVVAGDLRKDDRVRTVSGAALRRLTVDEAVPIEELGQHVTGALVTGWVLIADRQAVATAYTHRNGTDLGIYAVGTLPAWRRRGMARALVEHVLADAYDAGIETATLQSTPMGEPLYAMLGFRPVGRYEEWLHSPADRTVSTL